MQMRITYDVVKNFEHAQKCLAARQQARKKYVNGKNDITGVFRRGQSALYIGFDIAKVGGPLNKGFETPHEPLWGPYMARTIALNVSRGCESPYRDLLPIRIIIRTGLFSLSHTCG